jgi:hypothetical protein
MNHSQLRKYIRSVLLEVLEGPHISNVLSFDLAEREPIGSLADGEEAQDPGVFADPYTQDYHVIPTRPIFRG